MNNENQKPTPDHNLIKGMESRNLDKIIIHTMPKRYLGKGSKAKSGSHKSTGLLILVLGVVILAGMFAAAYYFLIKKPAPLAGEQTGTVVEEPADKENEQPAPVVNRQIPANNNVDSRENEDGNAPGNDQPEPEIEENEGEMEENSTSTDVQTATSSPVKRIDAGQANEPDQAPMPATALRAAADTDSDSLSDTEEILLDTNPSSRDSDGDSFADGAELDNLYNPAGGGQIIANPNIKKYQNSAIGYSLYYPAAWTPNSLSAQDAVMFRIGAQQFVQIVSLDKPADISLNDWYQEQFDVSFIQSQQIVYKEGWEGVKTEDGLTYYLYKPGTDKILTINYNPGSGGVLNYLQIFEMMVNSLTM